MGRTPREEDLWPEGPMRWIQTHVPVVPLLALVLFIPGIIVWAVFSLRTKTHTVEFFNIVTDVSPDAISMASSAVGTTVVTMLCLGGAIFFGAFALEVVRGTQQRGKHPDCWCPMARPDASAYTVYATFNMGINIVLWLMQLGVVLLLMGALTWLAVAYAANAAIKGGVKQAAEQGYNPIDLLNNATANYTSVVNLYQQQVNTTPACVNDTRWFKALNSSIHSILYAPDGSASTTICPYTCLNLGSFATLFKLPQNCVCDEGELDRLREKSYDAAAASGIALGGMVLVYIAGTAMYTHLCLQYVAARRDHDEVLDEADREEKERAKGSFSGGPAQLDGGSGAAPDDDPEAGGKPAAAAIEVMARDGDPFASSQLRVKVRREGSRKAVSRQLSAADSALLPPSSHDGSHAAIDMAYLAAVDAAGSSPHQLGRAGSSKHRHHHVIGPALPVTGFDELTRMDGGGRSEQLGRVSNSTVSTHRRNNSAASGGTTAANGREVSSSGGSADEVLMLGTGARGHGGVCGSAHLARHARSISTGSADGGLPPKSPLSPLGRTGAGAGAPAAPGSSGSGVAWSAAAEGSGGSGSSNWRTIEGFESLGKSASSRRAMRKQQQAAAAAAAGVVAAVASPPGASRRQVVPEPSSAAAAAPAGEPGRQPAATSSADQAAAPGGLPIPALPVQSAGQAPLQQAVPAATAARVLDLKPAAKPAAGVVSRPAPAAAAAAPTDRRQQLQQLVGDLPPGSQEPPALSQPGSPLEWAQLASDSRPSSRSSYYGAPVSGTRYAGPSGFAGGFEPPRSSGLYDPGAAMLRSSSPAGMGAGALPTASPSGSDGRTDVTSPGRAVGAYSRSMRKGFMAYDQYKQRGRSGGGAGSGEERLPDGRPPSRQRSQRADPAQTDPRRAVSRRYQSRLPGL